MATPEEEAKARILAAVRDMETAGRTALFAAVLKELDPDAGGDADTGKDEDKDTGKDKETFHFAYLLVIALLLGLAYGMAGDLGEKSLLHGEDAAKSLLMLLGFVVALASYLASVARETIRRLGALPEDQARTRAKLKRYLALTSTAEAQLVMLGLLIIARIVLGPGPWGTAWLVSGPVLFDNFLVGYLFCILIFLSLLHAHMWVIECPLRYAGGRRLFRQGLRKCLLGRE